MEAHRLDSDYVMRGARRFVKAKGKTIESTFVKEFEAEAGYDGSKRIDWPRFFKTLLRYDPNSLVHGCFLENISGRLLATRLLSGFIEASGVSVAGSSGVKLNIVEPKIKGGTGNV